MLQPSVLRRCIDGGHYEGAAICLALGMLAALEEAPSQGRRAGQGRQGTRTRGATASTPKPSRTPSRSGSRKPMTWRSMTLKRR